MSLKKIIALLFILVLALQVLPIKQVGAILSSNQINEELPHAQIEIKGKLFFSDDVYEDSSFLSSLFPFFKQVSFLHFATLLPFIYNGEVLTPPPNCLFAS